MLEVLDRGGIFTSLDLSKMFSCHYSPHLNLPLEDFFHLNILPPQSSSFKAIMESDDEVKPIKYLDVYSKLPIDAPVGHPHIIDPKSLSEDDCYYKDATMADAVVTILFKVLPEALTAFLDLNRPYFHYIHSGSTGHLDFCIKREDRMVTVRWLS